MVLNRINQKISLSCGFPLSVKLWSITVPKAQLQTISCTPYTLHNPVKRLKGSVYILVYIRRAKPETTGPLKICESIINASLSCVLVTRLCVTKI